MALLRPVEWGRIISRQDFISLKHWRHRVDVTALRLPPPTNGGMDRVVVKLVISRGRREADTPVFSKEGESHYFFHCHRALELDVAVHRVRSRVHIVVVGDGSIVIPDAQQDSDLS